MSDSEEEKTFKDHLRKITISTRTVVLDYDDTNA